MKTLRTSMIGVLGIVSVGCSTPSLFPPEATRDAAPLEFGVLEAKPDVFKGRVVQLAGRIIGVARIKRSSVQRQKHRKQKRDGGKRPLAPSFIAANFIAANFIAACFIAKCPVAAFHGSAPFKSGVYFPRARSERPSGR